MIATRGPRHSEEIAQFFDDFESASRREDWAGYAEMFLPQFTNIDPGAVTTVAREDLIAFLPHRRGVFARAGASGAALASLDVDPLDERHVLARTTWEVLFDETGRAPAVLRTAFLLRHEDRWRIAVYLNHDVLADVLGPGAQPPHGPAPKGGSPLPDAAEG